MEFIILACIVIGFVILALYLKQPNTNLEQQLEQKDSRISQLENEEIEKETHLSNLKKQLDIASAKTEAFEQLKIEKAKLEEGIKRLEIERNDLKVQTVSLQKAEEGRQLESKKHIATAVTLQESLEKEKERLNDDRVKEKEDQLNKMKLKWSEHEKDVENHIQQICRNNIITYVSQEDFPHPRNKPDNSIEIMDQLVVFDAKSPANDDLTNFPKYIKLQTESLKKYAKHDNVKNDLFLVIPSNTLDVKTNVRISTRSRYPEPSTNSCGP